MKYVFWAGLNRLARLPRRRKTRYQRESVGVAARKKYRVSLLGEGLSLNRGTCGGDGAFVVQHIAAFTHEAHPLAGQLFEVLSTQRAGGDARLIGGGAGGNMVKPEFIHFVGVAGA